MEKNLGFSLLEVLVAFSLMTSTSLILIKQQWYIQKIFLQLFAQTDSLIKLDNVFEQDDA
jgi:type II secretory pathway component PulJ